MRRLARVLLFSLIVFRSLVSAQETLKPPSEPFPEGTVFLEINKGIDQLTTWGAENQFHVDTLVRDMRLHTNVIDQSWRRSGRGPDSVPYLLSLTFDAQLLRYAVSAVRPLQGLQSVRTVADDLRIKSESVVRDAAGIPKGQLFVSADVLVHTLKSGKATSGYKVWYVLRGWAGVQGAWKEFPKQSTPTKDKLPPGGYLFWGVDAQNQTGKEQKQYFEVAPWNGSITEIDLVVQ